ncbi:MAG: hypothetical protein GXY83_22260 [Rhodopirellula sp.]|nr:hypothetical protein [Rhodopirellula sp.]
MAAVAFSMFLTTCGLYFHVCRQAGMAVQWVFLIGFVPSWLVAVPAAYAMLRRREMAFDLAWVLASFTAYFWACGAFSLWKAA